MKHISDSKSYSYVIKNIALYRSDLEEIFSLLKKNNHIIKISDENIEYDSFDEICKFKGPHVKFIEISGKNNNEIYSCISITIDYDMIHIFASTGRTPDTNLAWHEIKDIISNKVPWYNKIFKTWIWLFIIMFWIIVAAVVSDLTEQPPKWFYYSWLSILCGLIVIIITSYFYQKANRGAYLKRKHELPGFWKRNAEKILTLVIGAFLGAMGNALANHFFIQLGS